MLVFVDVDPLQQLLYVLDIFKLVSALIDTGQTEVVAETRFAL